VGGADETITASLVRREINARLRLHTVVHTIPNAGHLLPLEAPKATADFIERSVPFVNICAGAGSHGGVDQTIAAAAVR
ncbi:MAG: alpha/beta hydrolase, partial [Chthoniobacterales bacterium]|nr:alpha/beta hydrolase [Chthoniobacterales bacterium]